MGQVLLFLPACCQSLLEIEGVWTWTLWNKAASYHLSDKSHAWIEVRNLVFIAHVPDPLFFWDKQTWLLDLFMWAWRHCVIDWELQTYYCSQTNAWSEWYTADDGCTSVRVTGRLPLDWNLSFSFQLSLLLSWWIENICDLQHVGF